MCVLLGHAVAVAPSLRAAGRYHHTLVRGRAVEHVKHLLRDQHTDCKDKARTCGALTHVLACHACRGASHTLWGVTRAVWGGGKSMCGAAARAMCRAAASAECAGGGFCLRGAAAQV